MEHIREYDWCSTEPDIYFLAETDIDNCVTEKILRNKFHDPLVSSESEDEDKPQVKLDWDEIFNRKRNNLTFHTVVQGIHPFPQYPKLSALTIQQHFQCIKVLSSQNPDVLPGVSMARPTKNDYKVFEEVKEIYQKEQLEYAEWAKSLWTSDHCVRALRPKPSIEMVYEAEFKVRANALQSFPKNYELAAQIPLENPNAVCELIPQGELIKVNMISLPQIQKPDMTKRTTIMTPCSVPEPCNKHPCHFVLPKDGTVTILPLTEINRELAQYAFDNGACNIASESALRCLMRDTRHWALPVAVCRVLAPDGVPANVVVLGSEFAVHKETAQIRTYKAFRRLLENTLVPPLEKRLANRRCDVNDSRGSASESEDAKLNMDVSDDDDDQLYIDTSVTQSENDVTMDEEAIENKTKSQTKKKKSQVAFDEDDSTNKIDFYNCTCKDTPFERPAPRSFRKWRVRSKHAHDHYDLIVHCAHRARGPTGEVIPEPIPEYQLDLAASAPPRDVVRAQALALALRKNASLLNVRIDSASGDIVTLESVFPEELFNAHAGISAEVNNRLYTALEQLRGLLPGNYVLCHEPSHGSNALLYSSTFANAALRLTFDGAPPADADEARSVRAPPRLVPALLPVHKHRRTLPCAFTPYTNQLPREPRRAPARQRVPPQALKLGERQSGARRKVSARLPAKARLRTKARYAPR